ncbi:MAG: hypothetical protein AABX38_06225 [Candidatus Micrarchaeota archaeon]
MGNNSLVSTKIHFHSSYLIAARASPIKTNPPFLEGPFIVYQDVNPTNGHAKPVQVKLIGGLAEADLSPTSTIYREFGECLHIQFGGLPEQGQLFRKFFSRNAKPISDYLITRLVDGFVSPGQEPYETTLSSVFCCAISGHTFDQFTEWLSENAPINDETLRKLFGGFVPKPVFGLFLKKLKGSFPMIVPRGKLSIVTVDQIIKGDVTFYAEQQNIVDNLLGLKADDPQLLSLDLVGPPQSSYEAYYKIFSYNYNPTMIGK